MKNWENEGDKRADLRRGLRPDGIAAGLSPMAGEPWSGWRAQEEEPLRAPFLSPIVNCEWLE